MATGAVNLENILKNLQECAFNRSVSDNKKDGFIFLKPAVEKP